MTIRCNSFSRYTGKKPPRCECALCALKFQIEELRRVATQQVDVAEELANTLEKVAKHIPVD